jgi:hypothetical protein
MIVLRMSWYNINILNSLLFFAVISNANGQLTYADRIERSHIRWQNIMPKYYKAQFAGGMGVFAVGTGWDYGKKKQWETDLMLGFLPKFSTDRSKLTYTIKQNYIPWHTTIAPKVVFEPLTTGLYINSIFGDEFWVEDPEKYPSNYYTFSTKMRFNVFVGQRMTFEIKPEDRKFSKAITLFYELGSNDLYLISGLGNQYIKFNDYVKLSLGVKIQRI